MLHCAELELIETSPRPRAASSLWPLNVVSSAVHGSLQGQEGAACQRERDGGGHTRVRQADLSSVFGDQGDARPAMPPLIIQ